MHDRPVGGRVGWRFVRMVGSGVVLGVVAVMMMVVVVFFLPFAFHFGDNVGHFEVNQEGIVFLLLLYFVFLFNRFLCSKMD